MEYGGSGGNFFSTVLLIEEFGKVDAAISGMIDLQNTLINGIALDFCNEEQRKKYLPLLNTSMVRLL